MVDLQPVRDVPPYLCDVIPERSFRRVTGIKTPLRTRWDGPRTNYGLCLVHAAGSEAPLGLDWSFDDGDNVLRRQQRAWADDSPRPLPPELGQGLAATRPTAGVDARPHFVIALFRCGAKRPWISIDFARVARGRDAARDMFAFMKIAQQRFGRMHGCAPRLT
ncbi:hypothetical protein [Spirillospora sp. CA-294931]|uniref:hypothetical protein n=1 Tax=Spirillospora sp. CA-294931 TaxID=3240042 RepID=UPI003D8C9AEC